MNFFTRVFDQMARMGLAFKSDPIQVIDAAGRQFGGFSGGFDLSIAPRKDQRDLLSVILRNVEPLEKRLVTNGWLHFLEVHLTAPDGSPVPQSPYGREALKPGHAKPESVLHFGPEEMVETELPLAILYEMQTPGTYQVSVSCKLRDAILTSNVCSLKHS